MRAELRKRKRLSIQFFFVNDERKILPGSKPKNQQQRTLNLIYTALTTA